MLMKTIELVPRNRLGRESQLEQAFEAMPAGCVRGVRSLPAVRNGGKELADFIVHLGRSRDRLGDFLAQ